jgi:hypothetical protein
MDSLKDGELGPQKRRIDGKKQLVSVVDRFAVLIK